MNGAGPDYVRMGRGRPTPIRYGQAALELWMQRNALANTAEYGFADR